MAVLAGWVSADSKVGPLVCCVTKCVRGWHVRWVDVLILMRGVLGWEVRWGLVFRDQQAELVAWTECVGARRMLRQARVPAKNNVPPARTT